MYAIPMDALIQCPIRIFHPVQAHSLIYLRRQILLWMQCGSWPQNLLLFFLHRLGSLPCHHYNLQLQDCHRKLLHLPLLLPYIHLHISVLIALLSPHHYVVLLASLSLQIDCFMINFHKYNYVIFLNSFTGGGVECHDFCHFLCASSLPILKNFIKINITCFSFSIE